jgi:hypothetical protein
LHRGEHVLLVGPRRANHDGRPRLLAHLANEIAAARDVRVDEHDIGLGQAPVGPGLANRGSLGDGIDLRHACEAGNQPVPVDRVGVEDEDLQAVPSGRDVSVRAPGLGEPQEHTTFARGGEVLKRVFESSADCPRLGRVVRVA